jgi:hypothetical protein
MKQTKRDENKIAQRILQCGEMYAAMEKRLWNQTTKALLFEATVFWNQQTGAGRQCEKPGRLENRRADALTCWFCENHQDVLSGDFVTDLSVFGDRKAGRGRHRSSIEIPQSGGTEFPTMIESPETLPPFPELYKPE